MSRAVVVATKGRAEELRYCLAALLRAGCVENEIVVSAVEPSDVADLPSGVRVIFGAAGAAAQRNRALDSVGEVDNVFFFDDDALVDPSYLKEIEQMFASAPNVVGLTGTLVYDGAASGHISARHGVEVLKRTPPSRTGGTRPVRSLYGCNFAVRRELLRRERFDENLPLYSWLEDLDLSRRLERYGQMQRVTDARCVHLGAKSGGRESHRRFGYSQVANPAYLRRKGSLRWSDVLRLVGRPLAANVFGSVRGDESRRSRLIGNLIAMKDLIRGVAVPKRILDM